MTNPIKKISKAISNANKKRKYTKKVNKLFDGAAAHNRAKKKR